MRSSSTAQPIPGTDRFRAAIEYELANNGVGPARVEWMSLTLKGKPMRDLSELMAACCAASAGHTGGMNKRGNVAGSLVPANTSLKVFSWPEPATENPVFRKLHGQMNDIDITTCYCSVFEECYLRRPDQVKPEPVKACVPPAVTFRPSF